MLYENMTFENIMDRCLSRVAASIDKREGSVVYDAIAPAAAELAIMYIELAYLMDRAFPDTEEGDDLTRKCQERSVFRTPATAAIRKGYFEDGDGGAMDVPIGSRYSGDALNYVVTEKIATGSNFCVKRPEPPATSTREPFFRSTMSKAWARRVWPTF